MADNLSAADILERVAAITDEIVNLGGISSEGARLFGMFGVALTREARTLRASQASETSADDEAKRWAYFAELVEWTRQVSQRADIPKGVREAAASLHRNAHAYFPVPPVPVHSSAQAEGDGGVEGHANAGDAAAECEAVPAPASSPDGPVKTLQAGIKPGPSPTSSPTPSAVSSGEGALLACPTCGSRLKAWEAFSNCPDVWHSIGCPTPATAESCGDVADGVTRCMALEKEVERLTREIGPGDWRTESGDLVKITYQEIARQTGEQLAAAIKDYNELLKRAETAEAWILEQGHSCAVNLTGDPEQEAPTLEQSKLAISEDLRKGHEAHDNFINSEAALARAQKVAPLIWEALSRSNQGGTRMKYDFVVVPREPTPKMLDALDAEVFVQGDGMVPETNAGRYSRVLAARPDSGMVAVPRELFSRMTDNYGLVIAGLSNPTFEKHGEQALKDRDEARALLDAPLERLQLKRSRSETNL